ncbi:hypothetical protein NEOLEDRAFT_1064307, partial [Neolentinus lepideus HHB14362 ss-1]
AQGQTIPFTTADIAKPPRGKFMSLCNSYVSPSRRHGADCIRLLQEFDKDIFKQKHDPYILIAEDDRLEEFDQRTKTWWQGIFNSRWQWMGT